ncbi:MAG: DUF1772 domain-containing protein [Paracoccus sp. (in: a-proteobacteria)]|nr:DUF1772 domain-containing protein [Paracoccus sp. (in: a-proteobacteria)]
MTDRMIFALFATMSGLMAGFFFAWTNPAMMGFAHTAPEVYVAAMQQINRIVQNATFGALFFGILPVAALAAWRAGWAWPVVAAAGLALTAFAVTMIFNVPMNRAMDGWDLAALPPATEIEAFRIRWQRLNTLRAVASSLGTALMAGWLAGLWGTRAPLHRPA